MKKTLYLFLSLLSGAAWAQNPHLSSGNNHTLSIQKNGKIYAWGSNRHGQCGQPDTTPNFLSPTKIIFPDTSLTFQYVEAGKGTHSLAIDCQGRLWAWGNNRSAQSGQAASTRKVLSPICLSSLAGFEQAVNVVQVAGGANNSYALLANGTVLAWGDNSRGGLGQGATTVSPLPVPITVKDSTGQAITNIKQIDAGDYNGYALTSDFYGSSKSICIYFVIFSILVNTSKYS